MRKNITINAWCLLFEPLFWTHLSCVLWSHWSAKLGPKIRSTMSWRSFYPNKILTFPDWGFEGSIIQCKDQKHEYPVLLTLHKSRWTTAASRWKIIPSVRSSLMATNVIRGSNLPPPCRGFHLMGIDVSHLSNKTSLPLLQTSWHGDFTTSPSWLTNEWSVRLADLIPLRLMLGILFPLDLWNFACSGERTGRRWQYTILAKVGRYLCFIFYTSVFMPFDWYLTRCRMESSSNCCMFGNLVGCYGQHLLPSI